MSCNQIIKLSSADRVNSTDTSSDFYLKSPYFEFKGLFSLQECYICNSFWNINASNSAINWVSNATPSSGQIPNGFYNNTTLAAAVANLLATDGFQAYTATVNSITNAITITANAGFTLRFSLNSTTNAASLLGFTPGTDTASATSQTGTNSVNLSPVLSFNILIDGNPSIQSASASSAATSFCVPVLANSLGWFLYQPGLYKSNPQTVFFSQGPKTLHIRVTDEKGFLLNLNNLNWYMLLKQE